MRSLTVLYDPDCLDCRKARDWLKRQAQYVKLEFLAVGSTKARRRFPELSTAATLQELTVVGDDGSVYRGAKSFLMCLWATRRYRSWALTLGSPSLLPSARRFIDWAARGRRVKRL